MEKEFLAFMEKGITNIRRDGKVCTIYIHDFQSIYRVGKNLVIVAGGEEKVFVEDDIRQRREEAEKAKMANMKGSGRFG